MWAKASLVTYFNKPPDPKLKPRMHSISLAWSLIQIFFVWPFGIIMQASFALNFCCKLCAPNKPCINNPLGNKCNKIKLRERTRYVQLLKEDTGLKTPIRGLYWAVSGIKAVSMKSIWNRRVSGTVGIKVGHGLTCWSRTSSTISASKVPTKATPTRIYRHANSFVTGIWALRSP